MSTMGTQINLGASYLINDVYRRFLRKDATESHYVLRPAWLRSLSRALRPLPPITCTPLKGWKFLIALGAGAGLVFMLRWYWWRINAWSEISAMTAAVSRVVPAIERRHRIQPLAGRVRFASARGAA